MKLHNFYVSLVTFGIVTTAMPVCGRQISGVKLHVHCPPRVRHLEPGWKIPVSSLTYETAAAAGEMNTLIEFCWGSARTASWVGILPNSRQNNHGISFEATGIYIYCHIYFSVFAVNFLRK